MNYNHYNKIQLTRMERSRNGITIHKILDIQDGKLTVRMNFASEAKCNVLVFNADSYAIGEYVDLIITNMSRTSYSVKFVGYTPNEFIPADNVDIAI